MEAILAWFTSLGGTGAAANAAAVLHERRREEWIIESLTLRLERRTQPTTATPAVQAAV
jgi:hypothetical protein